MNGQDRSQALAPSSFAVSDVPINSAAVVKNNSWLRDIVADPTQAAQAGLGNMRQDHSNPIVPQLQRFEPSLRPATSVGMQQRPPFPSDFSYPNPMLKGFYSLSALNSTTGAARELSQIDPSVVDKNRLLVPCVTSSNDSPAAALSALYPHPSKNHTSTFSSAADNETAAKRMKMTKSNDRHPSLPAHASQQSPQGSIPHRPEYFHRGSVIQLGENKLKRIEDLQTSDFEYSASISPDLSLDSSTVLRISEDSPRGTAYLTFSVGQNKQNAKVLEATVEATLEHPFFVFGQGWSSVKPESTLTYYKMKCQQLKVHDRCISLTLKDPSSINSTRSFGNNHSTASAETHITSSITEVSQSK